MKAAVIDPLERGPRFADFADPVIGGGEILVEVTAAGLHPIVRMLASGEHYGSQGTLPMIPGIDGTGRLPDGRAELAATPGRTGEAPDRCPQHAGSPTRWTTRPSRRASPARHGSGGATSQAQCSWTRLLRPYSVVAVTSCRNNPWGEHGG
jgi:hypothetical protein